MFWEGSPLVYSESPDLPATIQFDFDAFSGLTEQQLAIPIIKAGGIGLKMRMHKQSDMTIYTGLARREAVSLTVECNVPVLESRTYLADENDLILVDELGAWLTE